MTAFQKEILKVLFSGGSIAAYGSTFRLRDSKSSPVKRFSLKTMYALKSVLRKKGGVFLIDKGKVRQMHGKCWVKQFYKKQATSNRKNQIAC